MSDEETPKKVEAYEYVGEQECELPFVVHPITKGMILRCTPNEMAYLALLPDFRPIE